LIPRPECQFELRSDKDRIRLKLSDLRKKATKISSTATLSISFRTSKPNGRLLELLDGGNGPLGALDLVDGF
uniref:Ubiquitin-like domain-containing protein n=1 Tax=Meloidogyne hapla TaxID=6305 RepID=A0A1I8BC17_MELHA